MSAARVKIMRLLGAALVTLAVVPWLGVSPAGATDGPNEDCPEGTTLVAKFEWKGGQYKADPPGSENGVTLTGTASSASWTSTIAISDVVIKGGQQVDIDHYNPAVNAGTINNSQLPGTPEISNVKFCSPDSPTPTPTPTVTVTETVPTTVTATNTVTNTVTTTAPGSTETVTETVPTTQTVTNTVTETVPTTSTATVTQTVPTTETATVTQTVPTTQTVTNTVTETVPTTETATSTVTQTVTNTATETNTVTETVTVTNTATQTVTETQTQTTSVPVTTTATVTTTAPGSTGTVTETQPGSTGTTTVTVTETVTTTGGTSVLPTKIGNTTTPADDDDDDDTGVLGTKTGGVLADTGLDLPVGTALGLSFALLLAGGSLMLVPSRLATERTRRH